jgi:hypothetical protein
MVQSLIRMGLAFALVATGWVAGRAQSTQPDFVIAVEGPAGRTTVRCERGCTLAWAERGVDTNAVSSGSFEYGCTAGAGRCESGRIGGWLAP